MPYTHSSVIDNLTESISLDLPFELGVRKAIMTLKAAGFEENKAKAILPKMTDELVKGSGMDCTCTGPDQGAQNRYYG